MKVVDVLETTEFLDQEITLGHLDRVQKARCLEYERYFQYLSVKYPDLKWVSNNSWNLYKITSQDFIAQWQNLDDNERQILTKPERIKYARLSSRVVIAKKNFQVAGGAYFGMRGFPGQNKNA